MSTLYPVQIDNSVTLPTAIDNSTPVEADVVNRLRDAILAIERTLGTSPASIYGTVANRLSVLEALINQGGGGGGVVFNGDLSGTSTTQTVVGIYNNPVANTTPTQSSVLVWDTGIYDVRVLSTDDVPQGFGIQSFTYSGSSVVECGSSVVNPSFSASYINYPPNDANITNSDSINSPFQGTFPFSTFTVPGTFIHSNAGDSVTFTLNATNGGVSFLTANQNIFYEPRSFGGVGAAGALSATASGNNAILNTADVISNVGVFTSDIGKTYGPFNPSSQKIYLLLQNTVTPHTFMDQNGIIFLMNSPSTFSFLNQYGAVVLMDLYESTNLLSTSFSITVVS